MLRLFMCWLTAVFVFGCSVASAGEPPLWISSGAGAMSGAVNIAEAKGFFLDNGINGKVKAFRKGNIGFRKYLASQTDLSTTGVVSLVMTDFDLSKHKIIGTLSYTDNQTKLLARKSAGISDIIDLRGKKIATVRSTVAHFYLCKLLVLNGISCNDVELVFMNKKQLPHAIASGDVDAVCQHGMPIEKSKELLKDDWVLFRDALIHRKTIFLIAPVKWLENSPGEVKAVLKSILKAEDFIQENPDESIRILAKAKNYPFNAMRDTVRNEIEYHLSLKQSIYMSLETVEQWAIDNQLVKRDKPRNYMDFIDYGPLEVLAPERVTIIR